MATDPRHAPSSTQQRPTEKQQPVQAPLTQPAQRALAEAQARRSSNRTAEEIAVEVSGRGGLEPIRYGDWEVKGLASDF